jgi:hypothetical protein
MINQSFSIIDYSSFFILNFFPLYFILNYIYENKYLYELKFINLLDMWVYAIK